MKKLLQALKNMSFSLKIVLIMLLALLPMTATTWIYSADLAARAQERQLILIENNYDQAFASLEEKMNSVENISTLIAVNETVNTLLAKADLQDYREQLASFDTISLLTQTIEMSHSGAAVYYYINDDYIVAQDRSTRYRKLSTAAQSDWYPALVERRGAPGWCRIAMPDMSGHSMSGLAMVRKLWDPSDFSRELGVLMVTLDESELGSVWENVLGGQLLCVCTADGQVLAGNADRLPVAVPVQAEGFVTLASGQQRWIARSSGITGTGLHLVTVLPESLITQQVYSGMARGFWLNLVILAFTIVLVTAVAGWMLRRIRLLGRQLSSVPKDGLQKLQLPQMQDEIGQLISAYNGMVDDMQHMLEVQYDLGRAKASAELKALQSQINPHFLYNTLSMVSWMAKRNETDNIQQVMDALGQFYRLALSGGRDAITLREELRLCTAYMSIQQKRWNDGIICEIEADEELMDALLPKITLQPLIENAIQHGILQRGEPRGLIIVSAELIRSDTGAVMKLSVTDDGVGMQDCAADKDKGSGSHYGLKNIEMRLSLYYETDIRIQMESDRSIGTCVWMMLPVRWNTNMEVAE